MSAGYPTQSFVTVAFRESRFEWEVKLPFLSETFHQKYLWLLNLGDVLNVFMVKCNPALMLMVELVNGQVILSKIFPSDTVSKSTT